jgi:hypothetical protein
LVDWFLGQKLEGNSWRLFALGTLIPQLAEQGQQQLWMFLELGQDQIQPQQNKLGNILGLNVVLVLQAPNCCKGKRQN